MAHAGSDSENEGVLTNIQRKIIRPPGHTGKARKGHICFDGSHETMNLGKVGFITDQEYDIYIRPDSADPRSRFWFHFTVENTQRNQRVLLNIVNLSKYHNLFRNGMTPLIKSTSRPRWQRMPQEHVFYYRSPAHRKHMVLSFVFCFDKEDERYHFAVAQPYSMSRFDAYRDTVLTKYEFVKSEVLTKTVQERDLHLLTITHPKNLGASVGSESECGDSEPPRETEQLEEQHYIGGEEARSPSAASSSLHSKSTNKDANTSAVKSGKIPVVFLMGRARAADSPVSFIIQGFIDFMTSNNRVAEDLREHVVFKIVPFLNPDGVYLGNSKANLLGQDLNRHWHDADPWKHPTIHAIKKLLEALDTAEGDDEEGGGDVRRLCLEKVFDLHANPTLLGLFMRGNSYDSIYRFERHMVLPKILAQNCPDYSLGNTFYDCDETKEGTSRRHLHATLSENVDSYSFEVSMLGYEVAEDKEGEAAVVTYSEASYHEIGRNLARSFWDYYKIMGVIPIDPDEVSEGDAERVTAGNAFNMTRLQEIAEQRNTTKKTLDRADSKDEEGGDGGKGRRKKKSRPSRRRRSAAFQESKLARPTIGRGLYTEEDLLSDILSVDGGGYDSLGRHLYLDEQRVVAHYRSDQWKGPVVVDYRSVERGILRNLVLPPYHFGHGLLRRSAAAPRPVAMAAPSTTPRLWTYSSAADHEERAKKEIKLNVVNPGSVADLPLVTGQRAGLTLWNVAPDDSAAAATGPDTPESRPRGHSLKTVAFEDAACSTAEPDPAPPPAQKKTNVSDARKRPEIFSQKRTRLSSSASSTANARKSLRDCEVFEKRVSLEIPTTRLSN